MKELLRTNDLVVISALKAALSAEGIQVFEIDGDISSAYGGIDTFPRRLMVREEEHGEALSVAKVICPEYFV